MEAASTAAIFVEVTGCLKVLAAVLLIRYGVLVDEIVERMRGLQELLIDSLCLPHIESNRRKR